MRNYRKAVMASGLYVLAALGAHADPSGFGTQLETLMTPEQYQAAGLDKLSPAEREALYRWLQHYTDAPEAQLEAAPDTTPPAPAITATTSSLPDKGAQATAATRAENFGLPDPVDPAAAAYQLHATIVEPFRGWSGKTVFYLDNGQIWQQRSSGRHTYTGDDNRVIINQNVLGFFEMRLLASDRSIGVKRVK
jgi:hypothetical protein